MFSGVLFPPAIWSSHEIRKRQKFRPFYAQGLRIMMEEAPKKKIIEQTCSIFSKKYSGYFDLNESVLREKPRDIGHSSFFDILSLSLFLLERFHDELPLLLLDFENLLLDGVLHN